MTRTNGDLDRTNQRRKRTTRQPLIRLLPRGVRKVRDRRRRLMLLESGVLRRWTR